MPMNIRSSRRQDILLLIFSITGFAGLAGRGIFVAIQGFLSIPSTPLPDLAFIFFDALGMIVCAALLLPLLILCIRKLKGKEIHYVKISSAKIWQAAVILVVWAGLLLIGSLLSNEPEYGGLIALPFFMPGIFLPIAVLAWVAIGGLPAGSWRRLWASFGIGMIGSTLGAITLEYSLVAAAALAAGAIATLNPEWLAILEQIKGQITNAGDIQTIINSLAPYLNNPLVLVLALLFAAVIAPIIEETLKPAAIWVIGKRLHSPAEGFALGAACGAGFAMLEGTLAATGFAQMPGVGLASRAASSLLHITASGLVGWGIASSRVEGRHGRLVGAFLASTSLHGLWNGAVVLAVFGSLRLTLASSMTDLIGILLVLLGIVMLISLLIGITLLLPIINNRLKAATFPAVSSEQSDIIAQLHP